VSNGSTITFGPFTADPPSVSHCFITDAASGTTGNVLAYGTLGTARNVDNGESIEFFAGDLTVSVD
jgi:hypothetical protein